MMRSDTLDWNGSAVPGLHVAGNTMTLHETGIGGQSGYANTSALDFAALGACDAAGVEPSTVGLASASWATTSKRSSDN